jgi:hypothetical protein
MDIDEGDDASIRVAAGHDGKNGEQQHVRKLVFLPLPAAGIGNFRQQVQQRCECGHGNLRLGGEALTGRYPTGTGRVQAISPFGARFENRLGGLAWWLCAVFPTSHWEFS